jgi:large subunit ribosomal protein L23
MGILNKITKKKGTEAEEAKGDVAVEKTETKSPKASKKSGTKSQFASTVLIRPLISEKTTHAEADKKYSFLVAMGATKIDVKRAVKEVYGVLPLKVNMVITEGKIKRAGRYTGRRNDLKKAIVTVSKDKNLDIHEGV